MTETLKDQLAPLLEQAQSLFSQLPLLAKLPDDDPQVVALSDKSRPILDSIFKLVYDDYIATVDTKLGPKDLGLTSIGRLLNYSYFEDPLNHLHHTLDITICKFVQKKTWKHVSRARGIYECRSIARRFNARLAEEHVPLFVFVELK